jgi:uncharacterized membrane protein SirB2
MSLKHVHVVFISLSIVVTTIFGLWSLEAASLGEARLVVAIAAFVASAGLAEYARRFLRKTREL